MPAEPYDPDLELGQLRKALAERATLVCVHYACEDFANARDRPAAISCLCIYTPADGGVNALSLRTFRVSHVGQAAVSTRRWRFGRRRKAPRTGASPEDLEVQMLNAFYDLLRQNADAHIVHWNMNSALYGFTALASRYRFLTGRQPPYEPPASRLHDLDAIIARRFGDVYVRHPKLKNLSELNDCNMRHFLSGAEEARSFANSDFEQIELSTSRKSTLIGQLLARLCDGQLRTLTSAGTVAFADEHVDAVKIVLRVGERFVEVAESLERRHGKRDTLVIKDEYDAQDLYRSLLHLFFDDIREEDVVPEYAGASSRLDFWLPQYGLGVELKYSREGLDAKTVGEQLIIDRERYKKREDVKHLVCLVFDRQRRIENPRGLELDLSREKSDERMAVSVRIFTS